MFSEFIAHFLYRFSDGKKTTRSQFSLPGLQEIHRNLKQEKNFNSRESFFRKSPFCTLSCINPGFGGTWDKLWIFFLIPIFIMLQKNAFGQNFFWFSCIGSKVPFWQFFNFKVALLKPCMKFEAGIFLPSKDLYKQCVCSRAPRFKYLIWPLHPNTHTHLYRTKLFKYYSAQVNIDKDLK